MVGLDEFPDLVKGFKVLEHSVLEDSVELMLDRGDDGSRFKTVDTKVSELSIPIEGVKIKQTAAVENGAHASLNFSRIQEFIDSDRTILSGELLVHRVEPRVSSLESIQSQLSDEGTYLCVNYTIGLAAYNYLSASLEIIFNINN